MLRVAVHGRGIQRFSGDWQILLVQLLGRDVRLELFGIRLISGSGYANIRPDVATRS
jgi:hypothetical protein